MNEQEQAKLDRIDIAMHRLYDVIDNDLEELVYFQNGDSDKVMKVLQERYYDLADAISALRKSDD